MLAAHLVAVFEELSGHLHAGEAGPGDDEGEEPAPLFRVGLLHGPLEDRLEVLAYPHGVVEGPERVAVLLDAGRAEELGLGARAHDYVVEGIVAAAAMGDFSLEVDLGDRVDDAFDTLGAEDLLEAHLDRFGLGAPGGDLVQLGHEGMEGLLINKGDLYVIALAESLFQYLPRPDAAIASA